MAPTQPAGARAVSEPYNYPFSDNIPRPLAELADEMVRGNGEATPLFGQMAFEASRAGLAATNAHDLWGPSKDLLLYIRPTTMAVTANGYAVLTPRAHTQRVIADFCERYTSMLNEYRARGSYPMNMPVEIRATGLDHPDEVELDGARAPLLSALAPRPDRPEWDVAVWFDTLTFPGTQEANTFYRELEGWMDAHFGDSVRPEWSKGWAYTEAGAWTDETMLSSTIPSAYAGWEAARAHLDTLDPHRIFGNAFLDRLL